MIVLIKAVIFDFDGTIIDTESAVFETYRGLLMDEYLYDLSLETFSSIVGTTDGALFDLIDKTLENPINRKLFTEKAHLQLTKVKDQLVLREGFLDILKNIKEKGLQLALASSSKREWIVGFLEQHKLTEYFPIIFTAEDVDEVKPNPALYIKSLEALGLDQDEVIAVEDSANGSLAAIRAGINCLVIPNEVTQALEFHKEAHIIESYADFDLSHYLKKATWKRS